MPHGADLKTIRREIAFSAILITGMLLEIWITLYREFNYDFSNTPEILPIAQYLIGLCIIVSFIGIIWSGFIARDVCDVDT